LQDLCAPAIQRIQAQGAVFAQPGCGKPGQALGYGQSPNGAWSHELIFWHVSLMFVEYIAGVSRTRRRTAMATRIRSRVPTAGSSTWTSFAGTKAVWKPWSKR